MTPSGPSRPKLRTQVLAGVLTITLIVLAAFDFAAVNALRRYLLGQTDSGLQKVLTTTQPQLNVLIPAAKRGQRGKVPMLGDYWVAFVPAHGPVLTLENWPGPAPAFTTTISSGVSFAVGKQSVSGGSAGYRVASKTVAAKTVKTVKTAVPSPRAITEKAPAGGGQYQVAAVQADTGTLVASADLASVDAVVGRFQAIVLAGSAAAGLIIFLGVVLIMRRGLRPIEAMAAQADRISAGDLTGRVSGIDARSEVGRLGTALNGMLARVEAYVTEREASEEHMRCFFADASHELRNPLASLRANAELYQQGALHESWQVDEVIRRIGLEAQRMSGLVDDMLRLARLDQHPGREHAPVDVSAVIDECVQRALIAHPGRAWRVRADDGLVAAGDEELLRRAIDNLLANVCAHTPDDTIATVAATGCDGTVLVEVSDDGPGVPDDLLPRIFDRFYRANAPAHRPGSGLGLAIVAEIAAAHQGAVQAMRNDPSGLCVTVTLPEWSMREKPGSGLLPGFMVRCP
jgi:two-component system, OmpR family, sensor kinase